MIHQPSRDYFQNVSLILHCCLGILFFAIPMIICEFLCLVTQAETFPTSCGMGSNKCRTIIGAWAVGVQGECAHSDVGFRIGQNGFKFAMMQVHILHIP
jgi:hypothetical protein